MINIAYKIVVYKSCDELPCIFGPLVAQSCTFKNLKCSKQNYRGSLHFMISEFQIPAISSFCISSLTFVCKFLAISWLLRKNKNKNPPNFSAIFFHNFCLMLFWFSIILFSYKKVCNYHFYFMNVLNELSEINKCKSLVLIDVVTQTVRYSQCSDIELWLGYK